MKYKKDSVNNAYQTIRNSLFCHSRPADQPTAQPYPVFTFTNTHFWIKYN